MNTYIGVDLGTTQLNVGLFDAAGHMLRTASERYPLESPAPDAAEQDAAKWWQALCACLHRIKTEQEQVDDTAWERIAGIAVVGQGPTVVAVGDDDLPLRPALT